MQVTVDPICIHMDRKLCFNKLPTRLPTQNQLSNIWPYYTDDVNDHGKLAIYHSGYKNGGLNAANDYRLHLHDFGYYDSNNHAALKSIITIQQKIQNFKQWREWYWSIIGKNAEDNFQWQNVHSQLWKPITQQQFIETGKFLFEDQGNLISQWVQGSCSIRDLSTLSNSVWLSSFVLDEWIKIINFEQDNEFKVLCLSSIISQSCLQPMESAINNHQ